MRWNTVLGGLEANGQCFSVCYWVREYILQCSLGWRTESWEAEDYLIVEARLRVAGSRVVPEVELHFALDG